MNIAGSPSGDKKPTPIGILEGVTIVLETLIGGCCASGWALGEEDTPKGRRINHGSSGTSHQENLSEVNDD